MAGENYMKDVGYPLRLAFHNKLAAISFGGNLLSVYDNIPSNPTYPFIQVSNISISDFSTKTNFNYNAVVTVEIFTGTDGSNYSRKDVDEIGDIVMFRILNRDSRPFFITDNFKFVTNNLESINYVENQYDGFYEVRKIIRIRTLIEQS
jgi:hypothetical protein